MPNSDPGLSDFRRDVFFYVWGGLRVLGLDTETAGELAADTVVIVLDRMVKINKTEGNA